MSSKVEERVKEAVLESSKPVSVDYVRYHANTTWAIAKATLLELVIRGEIVGLKTSKSWIFGKPEAMKVIKVGGT